MLFQISIGQLINAEVSIVEHSTAPSWPTHQKGNNEVIVTDRVWRSSMDTLELMDLMYGAKGMVLNSPVILTNFIKDQIDSAYLTYFRKNPDIQEYDFRERGIFMADFSNDEIQYAIKIQSGAFITWLRFWINHFVDSSVTKPVFYCKEI